MITRRAALLGTLLAGQAHAQPQTQPARPLRIAFADPVSSLDPQLNNNAGDRSVALFFFDLLVNNNNNALQPGLATGWRAQGPLEWVFTLRQGVLWHDGQPFTADDVIFSYQRAPSVPGSVASFASYLRTIAKVEADGPHTLRITTKEPNPNLPSEPRLRAYRQPPRRRTRHDGRLQQRPSGHRNRTLSFRQLHTRRPGRDAAQ